MRRVFNWELRLLEWAEAQVGKEFVWGETDCASLVRGALRMVYGEDVFPNGPDYATKKEALEAAQKKDVKNWLVDVGARVLRVELASMADVIISPNEGDFTDSAMVVIVPGKMLVTNPGEQVKVLSLWTALQGSIALRLPYEW